MEKITEKIAALPPDTNYFSLEFFPPKTSMGSSNLRARLDRMSRALRPLFVTVTWGAADLTAIKSLELAELCQRDLGLTTCLHLTCTNMSRALVDQALEDAKALGIRNILALRGDPPRSEEYRAIDEKNGDTPAMDWEFEWAIDLVRYIRKQYGDYFCVGVAAYPEGHADEGHPEGQSLEHDLPYLVEKVQAGADFIMTQLFFDVDAYDGFEQKLRDHPSGAFKDIPIIPGMMPIQSYQMIKRTTKLSHAKLPSTIITRLDAVRGDDEMVKKVGVDILSEMVEHLKGTKSQYSGPRGFHFYTLNLEKAVSFILERTELIPDAETVAALEPEFVPTIPDIADLMSIHSGSHKRSSRRRSSVGSDPYNRIIITAPQTSNPSFEATAQEAGIPAEAVNSRANTLAISEGEDSIFGWGPKNGFVFQKAFVELFLPTADWKTLHAKLTSPELRDTVSFYASNAKGDFISSDEAVGSTNAVTWGAFPGKEIITPTIIEEVSFRAWAEEAFGIWGEWARVYGKDSQTRKIIDGIKEDVWLVNVSHHAYCEGEGLWDVLLN
ncbi:uncharacterized protein EAF02_003684 [Botrytis sinoallii]|uniref:uncharacterized protein n=1 Tax=Botrytis sinoallii TaxID=1463999 RepID=UPI00190079E4|nr:uncharacterized protein EAF02_003684 [Botrytis sinoallii]KAF7887037.1 hypothetical protein EAF02_003684 [Botrytis sinoallii]